jgi:hypothetical protein
MIWAQLGSRRKRRDHSNVQLVRTTRSRNNDVAWSSITPSTHGRARYASSVYAKVRMQPIKKLIRTSRPYFPFPPLGSFLCRNDRRVF